MNTSYVLVLAFAIGLIAGLRSMTAPALISWAAHLKWIELQNSPLSFLSSTAAAYILMLAAIGELIADKLPKTPKRIALPPLMARILTGGLCGASLCAAAGQSLLGGALLGGTGSLIGAFVGYEIRRRIVNNLQIKDIFVAICEDLVAIALAYFLVWH